MTAIIYIFLFFVMLALMSIIINLFKVQVWMKSRLSKSQLLCIGYLDYKGDGSVPEAHLMGHSKGASIGRVKIGDDDENCYVEILTSDLDVEPKQAQYRTCGYITPDGMIYKQPVASRKPELIGYTARPSNPSEPTLRGERTWRSLWMKCTLHAYKGKPRNLSNKAKEPWAICQYTSLRTARNDFIPPEARAAAFSALFGLYNKNDYHEYYNSPAYGWRDTALLAATIYSILYSVWYIICVKVLGLHFIGYKFWLVPPAFGMFFVLWAIVRAIKIECVENSNTIQPKLDLFNKSLGQHSFDSCIVLCCMVVLMFTGTYYRFNFVALALAVITGVTINMSLRSSRTRWEMNNPFAPDNEGEEAAELPKNPEGDIARNYKWQLDSDTRKDVYGEVTLYFSQQYIDDLRYLNPFYSQRKGKPIRSQVRDMFHFMKEHKGITARLRYTANQIRWIARQRDLNDEEQLQFTLDFVQEPNIRFCMNRDSEAINRFEHYIRYPDEVLYDKEADSNSKALLAAMLFHYMGFNTLFLFSRSQRHAAIGVSVRTEWVDGNRVLGHKKDDITFTHEGKRYVFCETTGDKFRIGGTLEGMSYDDFDEQVELPLVEKDVDDNNEDTVTRVYRWDLDPNCGIELHGEYSLDFNPVDIDELRQMNPFRTYGAADDNNSYDANVRTIFSYLSQEVDRTDKIREIADYIRKKANEAKLSELNLIQFALDFVQEPNIKYRIDEESRSIKFAKEYMRFPDEVLFDKEGDCDCKSSLAAALFHELGFNIIVLLSGDIAHAAIGIELNQLWLADMQVDDRSRVIREYNGKEYVYCETTGDGYRVGRIQDEFSIQDFETIVELNSENVKSEN